MPPPPRWPFGPPESASTPETIHISTWSQFPKPRGWRSFDPRLSPPWESTETSPSPLQSSITLESLPTCVAPRIPRPRRPRPRRPGRPLLLFPFDRGRPRLSPTRTRDLDQPSAWHRRLWLAPSRSPVSAAAATCSTRLSFAPRARRDRPLPAGSVLRGSPWTRPSRPSRLPAYRSTTRIGAYRRGTALLV